MALGTVSFTLGNGEPIAFAVYSVDDQSLDFYKRLDAPEPGDTFEGKVVTDVYTGFEENRYIPLPGNGGQNWLPDATNSAPWFSHHLDVMSVSVIDDGIRPKYLNCWFQNFQKCRTFDLNRLDMSGCSSLYTALSYCTSATSISVSSWDVSQVNDFTHAFLCCEALETLDLSDWNTSSAKIFHSTFNGCSKLKNLLIGPAWDFSHVWQCRYMFARCTDLAIDCSEWDVSGIKLGKPDEIETSWHFCFNYDAPGVILPKPWQAGAFAIYSADDGSLDFYKRVNCELPIANSTFNSKTVTSVYTGFEDNAYTGTWPNDNCPWFSIATKVKSVTVADIIRPKSMAWWFNQFCNCKSFNLGNIDTSECVSLRRLFSTCASCISITGLDRWDTSSMIDLSATFDGTYKLKTIPGISCWNTSRVKYFAMAFYNLDSLEQLNLSNWDDSSMMPDTWVDGIGYSKIIVGNGGGNMKSFKSFSIGAKWSRTSNLARSIEQASGSTIPADGKWYAASDGAAYGAAAVPSNKTDTYYATPTPLQSAIAKEPADWTLDDQKTVAEDIEKKGNSSELYSKAKDAMDAGIRWSVTLNNGDVLEYKIIGINHDDLADGSGKAGLTFMTTTKNFISSMNSTDTSVGGWQQSELRQKMNSGEIWNALPARFQNKIAAVKKVTNNDCGGIDSQNAAVTATTDKLFLLSHSETGCKWLGSWPGYAWIEQEGSQYEAFQGKVAGEGSDNQVLSNGVFWSLRSPAPNLNGGKGFLCVTAKGSAECSSLASNVYYVFPVFCF